MSARVRARSARARGSAVPSSTLAVSTRTGTPPGGGPAAGTNSGSCTATAATVRTAAAPAITRRRASRNSGTATTAATVRYGASAATKRVGWLVTGTTRAIRPAAATSDTAVAASVLISLTTTVQASPLPASRHKVTRHAVRAGNFVSARGTSGGVGAAGRRG